MGNNETTPVDKEENRSNAPVKDDDVEQLTDALDKVKVSDDKPNKKVDNGESKPSEALQQFASWIKKGQVGKLLVVTGAGISVSAGIPDFRTEGTGLYDNLQKYNLPYPEAVFDLDFFARKPQPFVTLAKELWPTGLTFKPTITHCFLTLLSRKNVLLRVYSQNIDGLEHLAQLPTEKLVECHGHFRTASCIRCKRSAPDMEVIKETIIDQGQAPVCKTCKQGYVKPDIVFFGEGLPAQFHSLLPRDLKEADCCLVLGTSLQVAPVSQIPEQVKRGTKRALINRELVGSFSSKRFGQDLVELDDCDKSIRSLANILGWLDELEALHAEVNGD
uniref:NAD-dependent protein deacetylase n=1 Tax=Entomoneis paludosa TaxID=265537 RepID=A0A7S2Y729_9STRA|mmetsp:Transcript_20552/g.43067  ORF Transcript_20552/g.43067 Transcript_20552/m.43067 type:complete len:332 (+) Transcript_20552:305-1300(+)|eukprot:CAMPEP_0172458878 /NCGR_PEP_ID=MMETSP1065-20121228/29874_1 /TAXON_ID=265537 /ORGANISM="Amphiprora paludosa, Strain CCMP125" /LENGTH=331 /DNA_ID=CAMNT_0013213333 /DNA_START=259 /DNA_END=1254 /DNA_ORIENTATION=-